ncbi:MAG: hypothetical protein Q9205_003172 [Flavoplaca limonia]
MAGEATMSTGHDILGAAIIDDISASVVQHQTAVEGQGLEESADDADRKKKYTGVDSAGNLSEGYLDLATIPPQTSICGDVDDDGRFRLPFTLLNRSGAGLNAYNDDDSGSRAIIAIVPKAYVGWYSQLLEGGSGGGFWKKNWGDGHGAVRNTDEATLKRYQVFSLQGIAKRIDPMYGEGKTRSVVIFQELIDRVVEFEEESAAAGPRNVRPDFGKA